ncbi:hypothetical protein [Alcaligenes sp. SMD-FA]|nr:hypothetical protein [Alcaligenes sp. SMD-FA]UYY86946.1 hypothetical protein OKX01_16830 [Alcaligenes sp. SMD-FA]
MNVHYLFGEPPAEVEPYRDFLRELLAEATPMEADHHLVEIKKTAQD